MGSTTLTIGARNSSGFSSLNTYGLNYRDIQSVLGYREGLWPLICVEGSKPTHEQSGTRAKSDYVELCGVWLLVFCTSQELCM